MISMLRFRPPGWLMWLDKVKSATFMFFKVSNFLNLTFLFVIVEDPPLQSTVRSCPWEIRNVNDDMDMPSR